MVPRLSHCQAFFKPQNHMEAYKKNWFKYIVGFIVCMLLRLVPFRPPNIEPILATQMPFSRAYGAIPGFLFAFLSIVLFDLITMKIGLWTLLTAVTYGLLGIFAVYFFKNRKGTGLNYAYFAILGTLFFDIITGVLAGPIFFSQNFMEALTGQVPFTLLHLAGNISFAFLLSPLIYKYVIENEKLETTGLLNIFKAKKI